MKATEDECLVCTIPEAINKTENISLGHGGGGSLMQELLVKTILPKCPNNLALTQHDAAVLTIGSNKLAFTTDSYVVNPLFFPGGDIGCLSIYGTVNDLAMTGAKPLYISLSLILEEGCSLQLVERVMQSIYLAAQRCNVTIVTGDTKVVNKGKGDKIYINTAGVGIIEHNLGIHPSSIQEGDVIIVNGDLARHGMAIMLEREGLSLKPKITSDCAPFADLIEQLLAANLNIHCLRDITRGGLASISNELASDAKLSFYLEESKIPIQVQVQNTCQMLGLDPLQVACEGRFMLLVPESAAAKAKTVIDAYYKKPQAAIIGKVIAKQHADVILETTIGTKRILEQTSGELLPRIC